MKKAVDNAPSYQSTSGGLSAATTTTSTTNASTTNNDFDTRHSLDSSAIVGAAAGGGYQQSQLKNGQLSNSSTMSVQQENVPIIGGGVAVGMTEIPSGAGADGAPPTPGIPTRNDKTPLLQADLLKSLSGGVGFSNVNRPEGLSTFSGVFCPVATSMVSVLFFLRLGFVVGQAGIIETLGQLALAYLIIAFTTLSLCAISTNGAIEGGGVYYMISRALGPEFGGAIGVLFFLANVFSGALSASGMSEVLVNNFGPHGSLGTYLLAGRWYLFMYAFFVSLFILIICLVGATMFARTSLAVLVACGISYLSFLISFIVNNHTIEIKVNSTTNSFGNVTEYVYANYTGIRQATFQENAWDSYGDDYTTGVKMDFAMVFGIVFSGLTGLMAGANMSGELRQPHISIPRGSLQAVLATFCIYVISTFLVGASCTNELLKKDYIYLQSINIWPPLILIGVFASQIVAAMSNLIGASRVLTRVGDDKLFGMLLYPATRRVCGNNPVYSVVFSWFLVVCVLLIGAMNTIAQVTSVFFLLSYAGVNLACLALELTSAPNFRPQFRYFSWHTSFIGFIGSVAMMFIINPVTSGVAIIMLLLLLIGLHYKAPMPHSWGSISQALIFHQVRKYLLMLDTRKEHVKFWRPQILLLVANPKSCLPLIDFVNDMKKSGLYVLGHVKSGDLANSLMDPVQEDMPYWLSLVDYLRVKAFVELTVSNNIREGAQHLVRLSGIGAMKPNTIVLGFYDSTPPQNTFDRIVDRKPMKFAKIDRTEVVEYFTARDYNLDILQAPGLSSSSSNLRSMDAAANAQRLPPEEYVQIIEDILKMNKNVILARHFHKLDKDELFRRGGTKYVDVWPVDIIRPQNSSTTWDNSSLFLLQLACILNMVGKWRSRVTLRVFLCVTSLQDMQRKEFQLKEMLSQLRIAAKSVLLPWDHVICHMTSPGAKTTANSNSNSNSTPGAGSSTSSVAVLPSNNKTPSHWVDVEADDGREEAAAGGSGSGNGSGNNSRENSRSPSSTFLPSTPSAELIGLPKAYLQSFHDLLIRNSGESAVVFLNMPLPPQETNKYGEYLECLQMMTENLPPTLLVHGISSVISTAL